MNTFVRSLISFVAISAVSAAPALAVTITFRQGFAGYSQAEDTVLSRQSPNTNFGASSGLSMGRLAQPNETHTLMAFYGIFGPGVGQIPVGSTINSATLGVINSGGFAPFNGAIHQMLIPWVENVATWNTLVGGLDNLPGAEFDPTPSFSGSMGSGPFPVTPIVQNWSSGAANYGFAIVPTATGELDFGSSDHSSLNFHPLLTIDYTAPVPEPTSAVLAAIAGAAIVGLGRRVRSRASSCG
jgi:hypothetical protein